MNVVFVGHVDHGKSTLIGRLLAETNALPAGKLEKLQRFCEQNSKPFEYAFLLDALSDEQAQGITIDIARCFFKTNKRRYLILDAPGHIEFLKNLITGAANAEAACLVIDAKEGVQENSRRHAYMLSMLGVSQVVVLVNKMDLTAYSESTFNTIKSEFGAYLKQIDIDPSVYIPISGFEGDNITSLSAKMPWYKGQTLLETLDKFDKQRPDHELNFRMPVQDIYKFTKGGDDRRIIAGQVLTGTLKVDDKVVFYPSGKQGTVKTIEVFNSPPISFVSAGYSTGFTLHEQLYIKRGEVACLANQARPQVAISLVISLFWLGAPPLQLGKLYWFKLGTAKVKASVEKITKIVDTTSLTVIEEATEVKANQVAECILKLEAPIAFDEAKTNKMLARFVLVDNYDIAGGGIIQHFISDAKLNWQSHLQECREHYQQESKIIWFTGLSGSGKTTLAIALEKKLMNAGKIVCLLDGDGLREGLNSDLDFSDAGRKENIRRIAELATYLGKQGMMVIVSTISPHRPMRQFAREQAKKAAIGFIEVYVKTTIQTCQSRDPKQLYQAVMKGEVQSFTGIDSIYEAPENPELTIETESMSIEKSVDLIFNFL